MKRFFNFLSGQRTDDKKTDNWSNYRTNFGDNSRTNSTTVSPTPHLPDPILTELYNSNGIAKRIVNIVVEDALRDFIRCDDAILKESKRLKFKQKLNDACCFGRLYGGSLIVAFMDDGLEINKPVNLKSINKIISFRIFDRRQIQWTTEDLCQDYLKEYYGEPEYYTITSLNSFIEKPFFKVHRSRCFLINGDLTDPFEKTKNGGWDNSSLQVCYNALRNYGIIAIASTEIVQDFVQVIMKMNGLAEKLSTQGGDAEILKRMEHIDLSRSIANAILLDGDGSEDYEKKSSSVAGLSDLWDRFSETICGVTGIPATKLFGRSPAGLNSTGTSDLNNWYDIVRGYRTDQIEPVITWALELIKNQSEWKAKPLNWEWEFPPLTSPSDVELSKIKKEQAEIDCMYIDRGAIDPIECWQERFGQGSFQINIKLSKPENDTLLIDEVNKDLLSTDGEESSKKEKEKKAKTEKVLDELYEKVKGK